MTHEKDVPDYALVPAREPEERILIPITQGAIYSPVQVTNITEKPKTIITIEEDILVPDTKPDLREILMIDGKVRLPMREIDEISKGEDYINISGDIELQTLYLPEREDVCGPMIFVPSRVSFKEQWHTGLTAGATMILTGKIEKIDYMVINERKYRVKINLGLYAKEYLDSKIDVFEGLADEDIQTLREKIEITNVAMRKKDILSLKEDLEIPSGDMAVETILKQDIHVVENYRQATAEKVVVNGFVYVNLLYSAMSANASLVGASSAVEAELSSAMNPMEDRGAMEAGRGHSAPSEPEETIFQIQERIEFTQFIPLSQGGQWSGSSVCFDDNDLRVKLTQNEEGTEVFRLEGDITTWVELYRNVEKEMIVDGYHREKDFICDFEETSCRTLVGTTAGETSVREILPVEGAHGDVEKILYAAGEVVKSESRSEAGKIITEGVITGKLICQGSGGDQNAMVFAVRQEVPFRCVTAAPQVTGDEMVSDQVYIKDLWAEKINGKQVELNATVLATSQIMRQAPFKVLKNPAFEQVNGTADGKPMVVYIVKKGDNLWSIAKRFKTTRNTIAQINQLEDETLMPGQKLLILK